MNLRHLYTLTALTLSITAPVAFTACGLGDDETVGGDTNAQRSGTGGSSVTDPENPNGGSATASGGQAHSSGGGTGTAGTAGAPGGVRCGNNTCGKGQYCCNPECGLCAPMGAACVQGCPDPTPPPSNCTTSAECFVEADYCTGCDCRVLSIAETVPACPGPGVQCLIDPCMNTTAACENGVCVAKTAAPPSGECTTDSDCRVTADYCTGCDCRALAPGESLPKCGGPGVQCLVDPCRNKTAACVAGACVARDGQ